MRAIVSPYELAGRELGALAALQLFESCVTVAPDASAPPGPDTPGLARLLEAWAWSLPLWRTGLLTSAGPGAIEAAHEAIETIGRRDDLAPLRPLLTPGVFDAPERAMEALSRDLVRGGTDPGVSTPVAAALARLSSASGAPIVRAEGVSVASRLEERAMTALFRVGVPVLTSTDAAGVLEARRALSDSLAVLDAALGEGAEVSASGAGPGEIGEVVRDAIEPAARAHEASFRAEAPGLLSGIDDRASGVRARVGVVRLDVGTMPPDAPLSCAARAAASVTGRTRGPSADPTGAIAGRACLVVTVRPTPWDFETA